MPTTTAMHGTNDDGFIETLVGDGRSLFVLTGLCLIFSGGFAVFQSITGHLFLVGVALSRRF